jgi:S1-C subfamily serine protease
MFKKALICLAILLAGCSLTVNLATTPKNGDIKGKTFSADTAYKSITRISAKASEGGGELSGTGFAIDENNIMTAGHVCLGIMELQEQGLIEKEIYMDYYGPDGETILTAKGLKIVAADPINDICIINKEDHGLLPVVFAKDYKAVKIHKTEAFIVGAPLGVFATTYEGEVVSTDMDFGIFMAHKLVVSTPAAPGNSGSPVFNEDGVLIGMLIAGDGSFDHLSICTSLPALQLFIKLTDGMKHK